MFTPTVKLSLKVAAKSHEGQKRKGTDVPYIVHPVGVMVTLAEHTDDEVTLAAALLHDVLEDCLDKYSEVQMRQDFGDEVTDTVKAVTKDSSVPGWRARNEDYLQTLRQSGNSKAVMVCAADKICNLADVLEDHKAIGDKIWQRFGAGKTEQLWWYGAAYQLVADEMPRHPLTTRLQDLVGRLERVVKK